MVSPSAQADIEEMWEAGLKPTVADIVRLNALGLIQENASRPTESMHYLRRCAWLGSLVLREPLLAHEVWLDEVRRIVSDDWLSQLAVRAFVCLTEPPDLPPPHVRDAVKVAVERAAVSLKPFTREQIAAAVMYATVGTDWRAKERAAANPNQPRVCMSFGPEFSSAIGVVRNGVAIGIGLTIGEAMAIPRAAFEAMVARKMRYDGATSLKAEKADAEDDYLRTLDEITARLTKEKGEPSDG